MFDSWHRQFVKLVFLAFPQWRVLRAYRWLKKLRIVCHGRWRRGNAGYPLSLQVEPSIMSLEMYLWPAQRAGWEILLSGTSPISSVLSRLLSVSMNISSLKLHSGSTECFSVNCRITGGKRQGYVTYPAGKMHTMPKKGGKFLRDVDCQQNTY
jgi:hypothetical protein